jgi:DNA-binding transcriptional ArsR family regulator
MKDNIAKELLDLTLHPVRMRILMLLSGSPGLTPQQMADQMRDVPQATLYRHINRLFQGRLLSIVEERPVRGTLEKVYALNTASNRQPPSAEEVLNAVNQLSKEDHLRYFTAFMLTVLDDFSRYLNHREDGKLDLAADGVGYHKLTLFLSDEEFAAFSAALNQALAPFLQMENAYGRKKRMFSTIMMPYDGSSEPPDGTNDR